MNHTVPPSQVVFWKAAIGGKNRWVDPAAKDMNSLLELSASIFIHSRRAANGPLRLVNVSAFSDRPDGNPPVTLMPNTIIPATRRLDSRVGIVELLITPFEIDFDRLYAGQPDPADESHFTIRYELNGKSDIIDGWLLPDDTLKFQARRAWQ